MSIRKSICVIAASIISILPFQVNAQNLIINNRTDFDSTSIINNGLCSSALGEVGISRAHTENNVVPESKLKFACKFNPKNCRADVYLTANCTGSKVATVLFDLDQGIKGASVYDSRYEISGTGYVITMSQNKRYTDPAVRAQQVMTAAHSKFVYIFLSTHSPCYSNLSSLFSILQSWIAKKYSYLD